MKNKKVAIVNLPWRREGKQGIRAGSRWPHLREDAESNYLPYPFFKGYAASLLRENGYEVLFLDAIAESLRNHEALKRIHDFEPDYLVAETSTVSFENDIGFLLELKRSIKVILCGPDANVYDPHIFSEYGFIDYVLRGEYEFSLLDLLNSLENGSSLELVQGLNYRSEDGSFCVNPASSLKDINDLPWPDRDSVPIKRYIDSPGAMPYPTAQMIASRGCPFGCKFCLWPQVMYGGRNYRARDVKDVIDEMEHLVDNYGFESIYFDDDTFGVNREWTVQFCEELMSRREKGRANVPWAIMTRTDCVDEELLCLMKDAGLWAAKFGVESGNQKLVDLIGKDLDLVRTKQIVKTAHALGIRTHLTFTFGLPGETPVTVRETIQTALELDPYSIQFSIMTPFPGTDFYFDTESDGNLVSKDWSKYNGSRESVIRTKTLSPRALVRARDKAYKLWNRQKRFDRIKNLLNGSVMGKLKRLFLHKKIVPLAYLFFITILFYGYLAFAAVLKRK